jgi:hypothetical protein
MFVVLTKKVNLGGGKFLLPDGGKAHQVTDTLGNELIKRGAATKVQPKTEYVAASTPPVVDPDKKSGDDGNDGDDDGDDDEE